MTENVEGGRIIIPTAMEASQGRHKQHSYT